MDAWTPQDWVAILKELREWITPLSVALMLVITTVFGLMQKSSAKNADKARTAIKSQVDRLELNTNSITERLGAAKLAQGTAEGHAAGVAEAKAEAAPAGPAAIPTAGKIEIKGTIKPAS